MKNKYKQHFYCWGNRESFFFAIVILLFFSPQLCLSQIFVSKDATLFDAENLIKTDNNSKQEKSDVEQRTERNNAIDAVADAMFAWTLKLRNLDPLWLDADDCLLSTTQKNWFDPRAEIEHIDCIPYISKALTDQLMHLLGKEYTNDDLSLHIKLRVQNNLLEFES